MFVWHKPQQNHIVVSEYDIKKITISTEIVIYIAVGRSAGILTCSFDIQVSISSSD